MSVEARHAARRLERIAERLVVTAGVSALFLSSLLRFTDAPTHSLGWIKPVGTVCARASGVPALVSEPGI